MLKLEKTGAVLTSEGWSACDPREDSITVYFMNGISVRLEKEFLDHAHELLHWKEEEKKKRKMGTRGKKRT